MCDATSGIMANGNTDGLKTGDGQGPARSGEPRQQAAPYALAAAGRLLHPTGFLMGSGPIPEVTLLVEQPNSSCRSKDGQDSANIGFHPQMKVRSPICMSNQASSYVSMPMPACGCIQNVWLVLGFAAHESSQLVIVR